VRGSNEEEDPSPSLLRNRDPTKYFRTTTSEAKTNKQKRHKKTKKNKIQKEPYRENNNKK